jgi:zinc transport system substrate-binding protein
MKKFLIILSLIVSIGFLYGCQDTESDGIKVAVSIVPQAAFVEEVGGDLVDVVTVIPTGFSPENYEPSARQIVDINNAQIYFTLGVPAESANIIPELSDLNIVHLEEYVSDVYEDRYFGDEEDHDEEEEAHDDHDDHDHSHFGRDPHIWLSIKRVKVMIEVIEDELSKIDPDNADVYQANASSYIAELDALETEIQGMFENKTMRTFIVYHPSYGYFADDYDLEMMALEEDGKEPSFTHLQELISFARDNNIDRIFHQAEIDSEQVETFKNDINGVSVELNPLSYNYIDAMREMAQEISEGLS